MFFLILVLLSSLVKINLDYSFFNVIIPQSKNTCMQSFMYTLTGLGLYD